MFNIKILRQRKADTLKKAEAILNAAQEQTRDLTDAERAEYDAAMGQVATLNGDITRTERLMDEQRNMPEAGVAARAEVPEAGKKPWESLGEQLKAIHIAERTHGTTIDPRLLAALGANEAVPAEGGFLVAPEFSKGLLERIYDTGEIAARCFDQPMSSNRLTINAVDEDSRTDGNRWGGLLAYWIAEAAPYTGTKPKFRQVELIANKLIALAYVTDEQLEDGPALEAYVNRVLPQEFAYKFDDAILNGPGGGIPLGVLTSAVPIAVAEESGQAAATIVTNNILKMFSRMWPPSRKNAVWLINADVEQQLYSLTLGAPSLGQILLYTPPGQNGNGYGTLFGKPVIPVEQCATLGTQGDIILGDFSQYILARRGEMKADSSIHVAFLTGEQAFRWTVRADGQPWWKKPLTPAHGSNTLSPFVVLATRS